MIERTLVGELDVESAEAASMGMLDAALGVSSIHSFVSRDGRRACVVCEAPSEEAAMIAAERAGIPADRVVGLRAPILPDGSRRPVAR